MSTESPVTASRQIVVMKFGGTSVATPEGREAIARRVQATLEAAQAPVLVVSAMGRAGAPYATDTLLGLVEGYPPDPGEHDLLASAGELVSAVVVAHELRGVGVDARAFSGSDAGIFTDGTAGAASITEIHPAALIAAVAAGQVPVVAGFQGIGPDGRVTTLGRGGSDTTACALGVALEAHCVEIYTDVDGVMTTDPRTCSDAAVIETISADELCQVARAGARVVHTPAAELALSAGLPVRVRNTYTQHPGTLVADIGAHAQRSVATAVTCADDIVRVRVGLPTQAMGPARREAQRALYQGMADAGISLDMFTPVDDALQLSISSQDLKAAQDVLATLNLQCTVQLGLSKVTVVGAGMHGVPGVMARVATLLSEASVDVLQVADSHTTIAVLVPGEQATAAVHALHAGFGLAGR